MITMKLTFRSHQQCGIHAIKMMADLRDNPKSAKDFQLFKDGKFTILPDPDPEHSSGAILVITLDADKEHEEHTMKVWEEQKEKFNSMKNKVKRMLAGVKKYEVIYEPKEV